MSELASILKGIADILWPLSIILIAWWIRPALNELLSRIKMWEGFGHKAEFAEEVSKLTHDVDAIDRQAPPIIPTKSMGSNETDPETGGRQEDTDLDEVLTLASTSPEIAVMQLRRLIERELRTKLANLGHLPRTQFTSAKELFRRLVGFGAMSPNMASSIDLFRTVGNKVIHGEGAIDRHEIIKVIDVGISLLRSIRAVQTEVNEVDRLVEVYEDETCSKVRNDVKGLILVTTSPGGAEKNKRIFPTTKPSYYVIGKKVSWEWNDEEKWEETWFRDPDTGEIKLAWSSALEFAGRHLDEIAG